MNSHFQSKTHVNKSGTLPDLLAALIIQLDDLEPSLIAVGMPVIVPQPQMPLAGDGTLLPELLDRLIINGLSRLDQQDPGDFAVVEPVIEGFQPINLLPHGLRDRAGPPPGHNLNIRGEEAPHALVPETTLEGAHRVWMGLRFLRPLLGRAIGKQHQGPDHLLAPLCLIHKA